MAFHTDATRRGLVNSKITMRKLGTESRTTFHRIRNNPALDFPKPVYLGNKRPMWIEDEVTDFIERMAAARADKPAHRAAVGVRPESGRGNHP
jgi:predicted DNA-binding transcriptional regulator AlpA